MEKRRTLTNHLPAEVIEEILYNLPVKSLLRFKCVSKSWRSLISSKSFVKEHLKKSSTDIDFAHRKLMLSFCQSPNSAGLTSLFRNRKSLRSCYLRSLFDSSVIKTLKQNPPKGNFRYITRILGSCNGLILITINQRNLFLWNPCTRKIRNIGLASSSQEGRFIYGLGYDEYTDDYKVVSITRSCHHNPCHTDIYSFKEDSWKKIEDFDKGFPIDDSGKLVNGRLHWLAAKGDGENLDIVSLDLVEEKYEIVAPPENSINYNRFWPMLKNLGGYLTLISRSSGTLEDIDVWVMIKYGERQSWTKIWTCSEYDDLMKHIDDGSMFNCLKMNGHIAVDFGLDFIVYKRKGELRKSRVDMIDATIESNFYVESLVSPFCDEEIRVW